MNHTEESALTYNVFRSRRDDVCCAVPEDRVVPAFLVSRAWSYERKLPERTAPREFDRTAARLGVRLNGFHLFYEMASRVERLEPKPTIGLLVCSEFARSYPAIFAGSSPLLSPA